MAAVFSTQGGFTQNQFLLFCFVYCRIVLLEAMAPLRVPRDYQIAPCVRLASFQQLREQRATQIVPAALQDRTLLQAQVLALFAHRARTTPTRHPLPLPPALHVPQARTAPASAPRPAGPACSALPAHTMIAPAPHQLLRASCVPRARTTPTLGRRLVPLAKRVPWGRTTMMWDRKRRADAR